MARGTTRTGRRIRIFLLLVVALALVVGLVTALGLGPDPEVEIAVEKPGIGQDTPFTVRVAEPMRGVHSTRVVLRQGEREEVLAEDTLPSRPLWKLWGDRTPEKSYELAVGRKHQSWLTNGEATLAVTAAREGGLLGEPDPVLVEQTLPVRVTPPPLNVLSTATYVKQGGAEAVVYRTGPEAVRHGVEAGDEFFPGYPLPGQEGVSFALFGVPYDLTEVDRVRLVAEDELGNRATVAFVDRFFPRSIPEGPVDVNDRFVQKVVPEIAARSGLATSDDLVADFVKINSELREKNRQQLRELGAKTEPRFYWDQAFLPFPGGQVMDAFAKRRFYMHDGERIDTQVHLGFDLASTRQADVPAANAGKVVYADYLGIYGNVVILDHGYGLGSLYAHLSDIAVQEGQEVQRGQSLGRSGETGLAGGDHLHFATLLRGMPVTPVEWWDAHWIQDRIDRKLGAALPFGNAAGDGGGGDGTGGSAAANAG